MDKARALHVPLPLPPKSVVAWCGSGRKFPGAMVGVVALLVVIPIPVWWGCDWGNLVAALPHDLPNPPQRQHAPHKAQKATTRHKKGRGHTSKASARKDRDQRGGAAKSGCT